MRPTGALFIPRLPARSACYEPRRQVLLPADIRQGQFRHQSARLHLLATLFDGAIHALFSWQVTGPDGWSFTPSEVPVNTAAEDSPCTSDLIAPHGRVPFVC